MSLWRQLTRGLRALVRPGAADRDAADEVQQYLDAAAAAYEADGMTPADARRTARLQLGSPLGVRDQVASYGWETLVTSIAADVGYALRRLRATPGFTVVTVATLAVGIGGMTAIFSAVNPILFASLPYPHPDRVVAIVEQYGTGSRGDGTFAMFREFAARAHDFASIAVFKPWRPTVTGAGRPERLEGQRVSASYFSVLGVSPIVGRDFQPADDRPGGSNVVILSDALWRRRFNADPAIVGHDVRLDDALFTVVGVMPAPFENVTAQDAGVWAPLQYETVFGPNDREWGHHLKTIARLDPGATPDDASREVQAIGRAVIAERHPTTYDERTGFVARPLRDDLSSGVRPALLAIMGAVALVLVIACVNVTNLLLARGARRRTELALRAALGAGRTRLVRQMLTESLVLAAAGGTGGVCVAIWGVRTLVALSLADLPRAAAIAVDTPVLLFAAAVTTVIGIAFGIVPALHATRNDLQAAIQHGSPRASGAHRRTRSVLVVAEVAVACVLLVSAGLLLRSLQRLFQVPLGFDPGGVVSLQVGATGHQYPTLDATERLYERQLEAVRRVPGVRSAGFTAQLPLSGERDQYGVSFPATGSQAADTYGAFRYAVSAGYLETMRIPVLAGRSIDEHDRAAGPRVALVSESLAKARFGARSPLGAIVTIGPRIAFTIVGIVGDVRQVSLAVDNPQAVYISAAQSWFIDRPRSLVVRAQANAAALVPAIRDAVWSVDKDQPITRVSTMNALVAGSAAERRFALVLFEAFGGTALLLATIGLYGILAGSVSERVREIGVRVALGATRRDIISLIVRQGLAMTCVGTAIGLAGAYVATRALLTLLFGVSRLDLVTYGGVVALLIVASAIACWLPAWRASRVSPALTLRAT